jgi:hypothetical protein
VRETQGWFVGWRVGVRVECPTVGCGKKYRRILVASGLVASLLVCAVGAILDFAITVNPNQHGLNLNTVGVILMIVGIVGAIGSLLYFSVASGGTHRHRTLVDDGKGNVLRREETYQ